MKTMESNRRLFLRHALTATGALAIHGSGVLDAQSVPALNPYAINRDYMAITRNMAIGMTGRFLADPNDYYVNSARDFYFYTAMGETEHCLLYTSDAADERS